MDAISFSGYGFDVTDFDLSVLTDSERQLFQELMESEYIIDTADELSADSIYDDITIATPCNTDDFQMFIYIPDQTVVGVDPKRIKFYSYHDADRRLTGYFNTFMHDLDSMENPHPDQHHTDIFLSMVHKLGAQIDAGDKPLSDWRSYSDYC